MKLSTIGSAFTFIDADSADCASTLAKGVGGAVEGSVWRLVPHDLIPNPITARKRTAAAARAALVVRRIGERYGVLA